MGLLVYVQIRKLEGGEENEDIVIGKGLKFAHLEAKLYGWFVFVFNLIHSWKKALQAHCMATHDDIMTLSVDLLNNPKNNDILARLQKQFQYVFVDEFQGTKLFLTYPRCK